MLAFADPRTTSWIGAHRCFSAFVPTRRPVTSTWRQRHTSNPAHLMTQAALVLIKPLYGNTRNVKPKAASTGTMTAHVVDQPTTRGNDYGKRQGIRERLHSPGLTHQRIAPARAGAVRRYQRHRTLRIAQALRTDARRRGRHRPSRPARSAPGRAQARQLRNAFGHIRALPGRHRQPGNPLHHEHREMDRQRRLQHHRLTLPRSSSRRPALSALRRYPTHWRCRHSYRSG